jgi:uncharacterized protein YjbI with pentapeptide repeats
MADQQHLDILKKGMEIWNKWRNEQPDVLPDLREADLSKNHLIGFDFTGADLSGANLADCSFYGAKLASIGRVFRGSLVPLYADLSGADLRRAGLGDVNLSQADLTEANLEGANLGDASLFGAKLNKANLNNTFLYRTNFNEAELDETSFNNARMLKTVFGDVDLSKAKGLEDVNHEGPLIIGIETIYRSKGSIPEIFLRKTGVQNSFLTYMHSLVVQPIEYFTCFISYSSKDHGFVERLYADLQNHNVRCWFASEDLKIGDKIRPRIDESIRLHDKLLLVLSEHSIASNWVAYEVEKALNKEPEGRSNVLFPIRLDDAVMKSQAGWADDIRRTRHIGDFSHWKNHDEYQKTFSRLLRDLKAEAQAVSVLG